MLNLFNPPFMGGRTPPILPMYDYIIKTMNREMDRVKNYYRENIYVLENSHRLIRLLIDLQTYMTLSPESLVRTIRNETPRLCRAYDINSPIVHSGIQTIGEIYKRNCAEVFISVEYDFDVKKCIDNFQQLQPIHVLTHDFTDLGMGLANGKYNSEEFGTSVFSIDLALLALQFKVWWEKERYVKETDTYLPTHYFAHKYPIVNMLGTHTDVCIFNRMVSLARGITPPNGRNHHSFLVADISDKIDGTHEKLLERFKSTPMDYLQRLNAIPSLQYGSYYRSVNHPELAPTRNVRWAMVLSRLNAVEFLLTMDEASNSEHMNLYERTVIATELRIMRNDRTITAYLPSTTVNRLERVYQSVSRE